MAISNFDTYTLSVSWGKFPLTNPDDQSITNTWCWHAIATHVRFTIPVPTIPTGWLDASTPDSNADSIECYAGDWSEMSTKISALSTFWG